MRAKFHKKKPLPISRPPEFVGDEFFFPGESTVRSARGLTVVRDVRVSGQRVYMTYGNSRHSFPRHMVLEVEHKTDVHTYRTYSL